MNIIDLIVQQTPEERQELFNEFIKLLNQKESTLLFLSVLYVLLVKCL